MMARETAKHREEVLANPEKYGFVDITEKVLEADRRKKDE